MLTQLNAHFAELLTFAKANPIVASAFGLWGLSAVTFLLRDIPSQIWYFVLRQCTTTLDLNSQDKIYYEFLEWISENKFHKFIRTMNLNNRMGNGKYGGYEGNKVKGMSIGYGKIWFVHKGHIFWMIREKQAGTISDLVKETISLTVIGRNQTIFKEFFEIVKAKANKDKLFTKVYGFVDGDWNVPVRQFKRNFETVVLEDHVEKKLFDTLDSFITSMDWYIKNGVPYRIGILLQGPPGTGKTTIIKALCAKYDRPLYSLNLSSLSDDQLLYALSSTPEKSIVAIEDIDTQGIRVDRKGNNAQKESKLTLSGLLNALDGVVSAENRIIIATTNHPETLDPALIREGRFDLILEIGNLTKESFIKYMSKMYENFEYPLWFDFPEGVSPAKVQKLVFENQNDYAKVIEALGHGKTA